MAHLGESRRWRDADALRQARSSAQLRKTGFDGTVALPQPVIFGIADAWRVFLVVAPVMRSDLSFQPRMLRLGLCGSELNNHNVCSVCCGGVLGCHFCDNPSLSVRPHRL